MLIDVSRLIWRGWRGRLPTGIDRVCLAYLARFGALADAVIQWKGQRIVLSEADSRALMALLLDGGPRLRQQLVALLGRALPRSLGRRPRHGALYLNIGHTGLDDPSLGDWITRCGLRAVHLIHDLIPIETPEFCRAGEAEKHVRRMTNALASATGIIGNSHATLEGLRAFADRHRLPSPPMVAAWLASDTLPVIVPAPPATRPYFVAVGTIEGRKNHILLLRLWKRLAERMGGAAPQLLLVGQRGWEADHALAMLDRCAAIQGAVVELGRCGDVELAGLLTGARALLMPSFAEGFGIPVIEALQLGIPVIATDLPVFREIAGDIPTYLPSYDGIGWERAVLDFCGDTPERARQVLAMRGYRAPDWPGHFAVVEPVAADTPPRRTHIVVLISTTGAHGACLARSARAGGSSRGRSTPFGWPAFAMMPTAGPPAITAIRSPIRRSRKSAAEQTKKGVSGKTDRPRRGVCTPRQTVPKLGRRFLVQAVLDGGDRQVLDVFVGDAAGPRHMLYGLAVATVGRGGDEDLRHCRNRSPAHRGTSADDQGDVHCCCLAPPRTMGRP